MEPSGVATMTGEQCNSTELELQVGMIKIRVCGTQEFVESIFARSQEWVRDVANVLQQTPAITSEPRAPVQQVAPPATTDSSDWIAQIANDANVPYDFINDCIRKEGDMAVLHEWSDVENVAEHRRVTALIFMYLNNVLTNSKDYTSDQIIIGLRVLGVDPGSNLRRDLIAHDGITSPSRRNFRISTPGIRTARELLQQRAQELRYQ